MVKFHGKGVYGGIAIGTVSVFKRRELLVSQETVEDTQKELERFECAKQEAIRQLSEICQKAIKDVGEENAEIFEIHMMMLEDEDYNDAIVGTIKKQSVKAEYAVDLAARQFSEMFASMDDEYMQARSADVKDISNRIIACLGGVEESVRLTRKAVICADDLAPSETVSLDKDNVLAFVTAYGSSNSHTAILARNMNIPAVVNVGADFLNTVSDGERIIVDGHTGDIYISPTEEIEAEMLKKQQEDNCRRALLQNLKGKENVTKDGRSIKLYANIGGIDGISDVLENDAGGIGLFRSEFVYLESSDYPGEEEQFVIYKNVLERMDGKKVIIRTLDIGADKKIDYFDLDKEENPALGLRAIRICLERPEIFKTQLRALYRASAYGNLGIMFPMITSASEVEEILGICEEVKGELKSEGISYNEDTEIGIMIETPAAAIVSDSLAPMVDFFSVGTNDLTQYTLACDRQNPKLERFCDTHHEAVLRLIEISAQNIHKHGGWIGICGELAGDLTLTESFLKMGIDELSVSAPYVLPLREKIRSLDLSKD